MVLQLNGLDKYRVNFIRLIECGCISKTMIEKNNTVRRLALVTVLLLQNALAIFMTTTHGWFVCKNNENFVTRWKNERRPPPLIHCSSLFLLHASDTIGALRRGLGVGGTTHLEKRRDDQLAFILRSFERAFKCWLDVGVTKWKEYRTTDSWGWGSSSHIASVFSENTAQNGNFSTAVWWLGWLEGGVSFVLNTRGSSRRNSIVSRRGNARTV